MINTGKVTNIVNKGDKTIVEITFMCNEPSNQSSETTTKQTPDIEFVNRTLP